MAFLDNSGDIILDAVLTDTGRMRLAKGDGSFKIAKFALGDDEIDYESYNGDHSSGSAYYDLEILQTPIFEAFTNNTANMNSKLLSLTNNNLLYLPIVKINETTSTDAGGTAGKASYAPTAGAAVIGTEAFGNTHVVIVDGDTQEALSDQSIDTSQGYLNGITPSKNGNMIRVDQGLDTTEVSPALLLDPELKETQYIVEIDSRFGKIYDTGAADTAANPSFIDDDSVASYYLTLNVGDFVQNAIAGATSGNSKVQAAVDNAEVIQGPRGTNLRFGILAATDLVSSDYLFTTLGTEFTNSGKTYQYIDSTIRVTGVTTGYRLDVPVRFLKLKDT